MPRVKTFNEINPNLFEENSDLLQKLIQIYDGRLDNVDVYIGKEIYPVIDELNTSQTVVRNFNKLFIFRRWNARIDWTSW